MAESAKKVEDMTSFLMKGMSAKADVKNVMNVVSVSKITGVFTTFFWLNNSCSKVRLSQKEQ